MSESFDEQLVIAVTSRALFDLAAADEVFCRRGVEAYRAYQRSHEREALAPGAAFPLVRRVLALNQAFAPGEPPVDVVLLSRNDPDSGLRILHSIATHGLDIRRAVFTSGRNPFRYAPALRPNLFLSSNEADVRSALACGVAAGRIGPAAGSDDHADDDLRIAFDFDGVLADDAGEQVYQSSGLDAFHHNERVRAAEPMAEGPLADFCRRLSSLQRALERRPFSDGGCGPRICTALITSRGGPAHTRVVTTLRSWGVTVDTAFFLGGLPKEPALAAFKPHVFFDDQRQHLVSGAGPWACAHVPFGIANRGSARLAGPTSRPH